MASYPVGQTFPATVTWRNAAGALADPATVELKTEDPAGVETTYTYAGGQLVKDSVGVYHRDITLTTEGYWVLRFKAAGGGVDAVVSEVVESVPSELVSNAGLKTWALATLQEAGAMLDVPGTEDDLEIARLLNDASTAFINATGREFLRTASTTRYFKLDAYASSNRKVCIGDASTVTAVAVQTAGGDPYSTIDITDVLLLPENRQPWEPITHLEFLDVVSWPFLYAGWPYTGYRVAVTGEFGFPQVPGDVRQAILEEVEARHGKDLERQSELEEEATGGDVWQVSPGGETRWLTKQAWKLSRFYYQTSVG